MAKGAVCPNCGEQTFQPVNDEGARGCRHCGARGWLGHPEPMLGRGRKCLKCTQNLVRTVAALDNGTQVQFCYGCGAVAITA